MLIDNFGRKIDYLRLSVTSKCNFFCEYCKPDNSCEQPDELSADDFIFLAKICVKNGIKKFRFTGGEPLLRKDLPIIIQNITNLAPNLTIGVTTNGYFLSQSAKALKDAKITTINISLDTLQKDKFFKIARVNALDKVINGILVAKDLGIKIKLNTVLMAGINDDEIEDILDFGQKNELMCRFIEYMPNTCTKLNSKPLLTHEILEKLSQKHSVTPYEKDVFGPANLYRLDESYVFGIISPHSDDFCSSCNRLRIMANGSFVPCLFFDDSLNVLKALKEKDEAKVQQVLEQAVGAKPLKNLWQTQVSNRKFYTTGG